MKEICPLFISEIFWTLQILNAFSLPDCNVRVDIISLKKNEVFISQQQRLAATSSLSMAGTAFFLSK